MTFRVGGETVKRNDDKVISRESIEFRDVCRGELKRSTLSARYRSANDTTNK